MLHSSGRQSHQDKVNTRVSLVTMPHFLHTCTLACMHIHVRDHKLEDHDITCCMVQVAAVERMLTEVDELPEQFKSAEIVYLSKNCLTSLEVCRQLHTQDQPAAVDSTAPPLLCLQPQPD